MNSIVCTLYDGSYHLGVAGLINSLYKNGYRGEIYIGYRGEIPTWLSKVEDAYLPDGSICKLYKVQKGLSIFFLKVETKRHLANYKPIFINQIMDYTTVGVLYFDPDIIVKCSWSFFERWITYGVAIVQEISSNHFSPNHPKRARWKEVVSKCQRKIQRDLHHYFNSGFCGVSKSNQEFLQTWEQVMNVSINEFGMDDNHHSKVINELSMFPAGDQDALNIAAMCCASPISDFGPEGMDFIYGGWLMSHAVGRPKPWATSFILKALKGQKISQPEKQFWNYADGIIKAIPHNTVKRKRSAIKIASFINRFYSRS